jgi:transcription antitermination factor NusG
LDGSQATWYAARGESSRFGGVGLADWTLAVTAVNAERLVSDDLARLSYDHIMFKRRASAVHRGRVVERILPAFPRYIFVPTKQCWDVLRDASKVLGLVMFGGEIGVVPGRVVDELLARCGGTDVLPPEAIPEPFQRGDRVIVSGYGPASGHQAVYQGLADGGRLRLEFDWFGRYVPVDVDIRDVSSLSSVPSPKRRRKRRRSRKGSRLNGMEQHTPTIAS